MDKLRKKTAPATVLMLSGICMVKNSIIATAAKASFRPESCHNHLGHIYKDASLRFLVNISVGAKDKDECGEGKTNSGNGKSQSPADIGLDIDNSSECHNKCNGEAPKAILQGLMPPAPKDNNPRPAKRMLSCHPWGFWQRGGSSQAWGLNLSIPAKTVYQKRRKRATYESPEPSQKSIRDKSACNGSNIGGSIPNLNHINHGNVTHVVLGEQSLFCGNPSQNLGEDFHGYGSFSVKGCGGEVNMIHLWFVEEFQVQDLRFLSIDIETRTPFGRLEGKLMATLEYWLFLLISTLLFFCPSFFALTQDGLTLLEIRSTLNDTRNHLSNWQESDESPCTWTGGIISPSIGKLTRLQRLALHQNSLHGIIPNEITNCSELRALYLRANYFQGGIPSEIGNLSFLTILDLSSNSLKGAIPSSLGRLSHLQVLNLSTNFLSGEIPDIGVLSIFGNNSFTGNLDLCGRQVQKPCRTSLGFPVVLPHAASDEPAGMSYLYIPTKRSSHYMKGVFIGAMSTMGISLVIILSFLWICLLSKKERAATNYVVVKKQVDPESGRKLITFHGDLPYPSAEIIEKLESLDEEDVVGSGGFGTVYRMVMNDCGTFAVKRIDRSREGSDKVFERELEILGSIKHINLVNLRGYCRIPSSKLLIYDYLAMGSLDDLLHDSENTEHKLLNWGARLKIALGSARGLAYLHHDCCPKIVHRDIKSSNILLDENLEPRVSDFGLAKLLVDEDAHVTTVVAGTFGYLAPEYLQSGRATEKSDVYSFGVLLLELVTGKRPTDPSFVKRGLNVVGWMNTLLREKRMEEVVDRRCHDADAGTVEVIIELAARCTDANPDDRPSMSRVLQVLEQEVMSPCPSDFYESHSDHC
ncbi:LRR receptor-like serine/threonine-protein kinase FEI 1 [Senna tora]|uniref:LRR receptor-like serine/threonine-protein kinase FEI 1 n=1 Tax=Senna tora TaxID=362788 RepID=A0A834X600_9FABA|nr:LRR receptor-like serine/threonine-protein kinase FEI 1 [Senna tora]